MGSVLTTQELFGSSSKVRKDYSIDQVFEETAKDEDFRSKRYRIPGEQHDTISYGHLIPNKQEYYDLASDLGIKDPENLEEAEGLSLLKHDFSVRRDEIGRKYRTTSHALLDIMANKKMQYSPSGFERRFGEGLRKSNPSILADALNKESTEKDKEGFRGIRNRNNIVIENLESYTMDLQENLSKKGHDSGKIDGKFGPKTKDAVKEFQQEKGLSADGFPGANTIKELFGKLNIFKVGTAEAGGSKNQTLTTEELFGSKELLTTEELFKDPIVPDPEKPSVAKIFGENFIKGASVLVGETSKGLLAGIQSIPTGVGGLLDILGQNIKIDKESGEKLKEKGLVDDEYIDRMEKIGGTLSLWGKTSKDFWQKASREGIAKSDPKIFQGSFMQNPSWTRATSIVAGAIPSLGAATVASMATGNPMTGLAFLGMLEAEPIHAGAIKAGEPLGKANVLFGISAVGTSILEALPLGRFMRGGSGKLGKDIFVGAVQEGTEEVLQGIWNNGIEKLGFNKTKDLFEGIVESFIGGAGSGGVIGGMTSGRGIKLDNQIQEAVETGIPPEHIEVMQESVKDQLVSKADEIDNVIKEVIEKARGQQEKELEGVSGVVMDEKTGKPLEINAEVKMPSFGGTEEAIDFGSKATPEQVKALKAKREEVMAESKKRREADDFSQETLDLSIQVQLYREAIDTAEGRIKPEEIERLTKKIRTKEKAPEKPVEPQAEKVADPLTEEAKKYKRAEEFVESQGNPLYHGTSADFEKFDITKAGTLKTSDWGTKGIYFEPSKSGANYYRQEAIKTTDDKSNKLYDEYVAKAKEFGTTPMMASINLGFKSEKYNILDEYDKRWREALKSAEEDTTKGRVVEAYIDPKAKTLRHYYEPGMITDQFLSDNAMEKGYDVVEVWNRDPSDGDKYLSEVIVMNPDVIKTKQQLTDIWNKAQEKEEAVVKEPQGEALTEEAKKYKRAEEFTKSMKTVFHGSGTKIDKFDIGKVTKWKKFGHFFTAKKEFAENFGENVNEAVVDINNPKVINTQEWNDIRQDHATDPEWFANWKNELKSQGFDGLKVESSKEMFAGQEVENPEILVAFDDAQVKTKSQLTDIWNKAQEKGEGLDLKEMLKDIGDALGGKEGSSEISPEGKNRKAEAEKRILTKHLPALKAEAQRLGMTLKAYLKKFTKFTSEQIDYLTGLAIPLSLPNTPTPPPEKVTADEGEEKVRGLSKSVADQAIEEGLVEDLGDLPTYKTRNMKDVASRAISFIENDYELAKNIALGKAQEQGDLRSQELFTAIRIKAVAEGDIDTIQELALSETATSIATELGQRIKSLDADISFDPVKTIQKVVKEREEVVEKTPASEKEIDDYKNKLEETNAKIKELEDKLAESRTKKRTGFGSKNKVFTQERLDAARASLKLKLGGLHSGVDPTAVIELTEIGGFYFEGGIREFSAWSDMLVKEFGSGIKPHLGKIWNNVKKEYGKNQVEDSKERIGRLAADGEVANSFLAQKLAEGLISAGIVSRNNLVKEVHSIFKESYPDITYREVSDLISGYGKYKRLDQDRVKQILRDIKGQLQQVSKLEDMQQGQAPLKTGMERRKVSDEERRLIKLVEDAKKKYNIKTTNPETQLKNALESYKTKLRNQIKDLEKQIKERKKTIKNKTPLSLDEEAVDLMTRKTELMIAFNTIFGKQGLSMEQRIRMAERSLDKAITIYEEKIKSGDISPINKKKDPVSTAKIEKLRTKRDVLKKQLQNIRDLAKPKKTAQEVALQSLKTRLANETERLNDKLDAMDFEVKAKREIVLDLEAQKLKQKRDQIKNAYNAARYSDEGITRNEVAKIVALSKEASDAQAKVTEKDDWTADNAKDVEDFFDKRNKLEEYVESLRPKNVGDVVNKFFDYFRASILASPRILRNSFLYQVVPGIERTITKRLVTGAFSDTDINSGIIEKLLAKLSGIKPSGKSLDFVKRQVAMATRIYHNTGIDISRLDKMDSTPKFFGERVGKFYGQGLVGKYAKLVSLAPKWLAGGTDMLFANIGRADTVIMMSKEIAKIEALQGKLPNGMTEEQRADQLLKDSYSFNPKDKRAATIRDAGIMDAHMMNNTQPGWWSDKVIEFRRMMSIGKLNFGKVIVPFAKIANVVIAEGTKTATGYGIAKSMYDINVASRKSNINDRAKLMRSAVTNLVRYTGLAGAALLIASFIDDDDYIGAYNTLGRKEYELARARNAGTNYVRIGGRWIALRYLPMLNIPISAIMTARQAKRKGGNPVSGYLVGLIGQILDAPGIRETSTITSRLNYAMKSDNLEKMAKSMRMDWKGVSNWSKVRMIPSVLSYDIWNALFPKDAKYDFMGREIGGGVFKEDKSNDITLEFNRLSDKGYFPTISKPTGKYAVVLEDRMGKEEYSEMLSELQKKYSVKVESAIKSWKYRGLPDEDKKKMIDKIRKEEILNRLKKIEKYG